MELGEEALVRLQHTSKEKLTEIFSNTDFCNKVASLRTELSTSPATFYYHYYIIGITE